MFRNSCTVAALSGRFVLNLRDSCLCRCPPSPSGTFLTNDGFHFLHVNLHFKNFWDCKTFTFRIIRRRVHGFMRGSRTRLTAAGKPFRVDLARTHLATFLV